MAENDQLSDKTKNDQTSSSSSQSVLQPAKIGQHDNAIVPHQISNHDKLVQTMVMVDGEWINVNDTNDQKNLKEDLHKVNKVVTEAQKGIVEAKNSAESAVKYADSAVSASKVNSDAIVAQSSAISEAKAAADDAASKAQAVKENAVSDAAAIRNQVANVTDNISAVKADVATATSDVVDLKVNVKANSAAIVKTNDAVKIQSKNSSDAINELKIANGQVESIAKDAQNNATIAKQTASAATTVAQDANSNAVIAKQTATSATIEATNATSTAAKAELSVNGLTTRVDGLEGDTKKLDGEVASTETILQQTKDQLLQKADKAVVDQANNILNQMSAEQKVMANQISSKVSSAEYQTLKGKVDNLQIGTRNLLPNSDTFEGWHKGVSVSISNDKYLNGSVAILNNSGSGGNALDAPLDGPYDNQLVTWTVYARADNAGDRLHTELWGGGGYTDQPLTTDWKTYKFSGQRDTRDHNFYLWGVNSNKGNVYVALPYAVVGNTIGTWLPNPEDTITAINKNSTAIDETNKLVSIKADKTEVNNLNNTAQQLSARLNVMAGQVQSKVDETRVNNLVDGRGFATQSTVQSLIDQRAGKLSESITNLTTELENSGGGVNLQTGTEDCSFGIGLNGNSATIEKYDEHTKMVHSQNGGFYTAYNAHAFVPTLGETYTISADIKGDGTLSGGTFKYEGGDNGNLGTVTITNQWQRISNTVHVNSVQGQWIIYPSGSTNLYVKHLKIERGRIATPYSQAPSDNATVTQLQSVTASIDGLQSNVTNFQNNTKSQFTQLSNVMQSKISSADFNALKQRVDIQTLDSADINNMKTSGHYFVRNLANSPISGWVYVDVTGNDNDRIRQDVYQDSGTKHSFRRWFGNYWTGWSTGAEESEITQLRDAVNLRVKSGELLSQINIAAGRQLFQAKKIYFDADSFVLGPQAKAFIPSAYITNINADKIVTGTLDAAKFHVKNFTADNISGGTLKGVIVKTGDNNQFFQTSKNNIYWIRDGSKSLIGKDTYLSTNNGLSIADEDSIQITTWGGAIVNSDGSITNNAGNWGHPRIIVNSEGGWDADGQYFGNKTGNPEIFQWVGSKEYTSLLRGKGFTVHLDDGNKNSILAIQKDNKVGVYVGGGDDANEIRIAGSGAIKLQGKYIDDGFNDGMTHTLGNLQVDNLHVRKWLGVDSNKNAIVKTSQGTVAINAYETAEYYFGDLGEAQTGSNGIAYVGIEKLFNETVNTTIPYQVFLTAYDPGNIWVDQRMSDRFVVKSDQPNIKFGWEIKAKRKGYEHTRLKNVDDKLNHMEATS